ncbi:MAG TPA: MaoC family dehydratase [Candidatus Dormibacteraeota bacterium]
MAGDFSPLTIEASPGATRTAPPSLILAMAVGLGTVDMPVPSVVEWEWLNWKFPRPIHAGETIYARWTLTQKRPPSAGAPSSIVVWRVDVHTTDGALCAEGEVGAKVRRQTSEGRHESLTSEGRHESQLAAGRQEPAAGGRAGTPKPTSALRQTSPEPSEAGQPSAARGRGRRRRRPAGNGALPEPPPVASPPAPVAKPSERASQSRRRRRRRPAGAGAQPREAGDAPPPPAGPPSAAPAPARAPEPAAPKGTTTLSRVIGRLRRGPEPRTP